MNCDGNNKIDQSKDKLKNALNSIKEKYNLSIELPSNYHIIKLKTEDYLEFIIEHYEPYLFWEDNFYKLSMLYYNNVGEQLNVSSTKIKTDFRLLIDLDPKNKAHVDLLSNLFANNLSKAHIIDFKTNKSIGKYPIFDILYYNENKNDLIREIKMYYENRLLILKFYVKNEYYNSVQDELKAIVNSIELIL